MRPPGFWSGGPDRSPSRRFAQCAGIGNGPLMLFISGRLTCTLSLLVKQSRSKCFPISRLMPRERCAVRSRRFSVGGTGPIMGVRATSGMKLVSGPPLIMYGMAKARGWLAIAILREFSAAHISSLTLSIVYLSKMCGSGLGFRSYKTMKLSRKRKRPHDWTEYRVKVVSAPVTDQQDHVVAAFRRTGFFGAVCFRTGVGVFSLAFGAGSPE
jgi:hypothetical protein